MSGISKKINFMVLIYLFILILCCPLVTLNVVHENLENNLNETIEVHENLENNLKNDTIEVHENLENNLKNETIEVHENLENNLKNETIEVHENQENNLKNETIVAPIEMGAPSVPTTGSRLLSSSTSLRLLPYVRKMRQVKHFYLFTRGYRHGEEYELVNPFDSLSIKNSHFKADSPTFFIVHGFLGNGLEKWILNMKDEILARGDYNVISVEWPSGSEWYIPSYHQAAERVKPVGNDMADLIVAFTDHKGLLLSNLHLVGHSLGAHVCGFTGKAFQGRVARITGLDPAGPDFRNLDKSKRLDKTDGIFVDVIHTNACSSWMFFECFGIDEDIGHVNFWPNGGTHQPFCSTITGQLKGGWDFGCSHETAYLYFTESFRYDTTENYFLARKCDTWDEYLDNNCSCGDHRQFMGINANPDTLGRFFLKTKAEQPFAIIDKTCLFVFSYLNWPFASFLIAVTIITIAIAMCVYYSYQHTRHVYERSRSSSFSGYATERSPLIK